VILFYAATGISHGGIGVTADAMQAMDRLWFCVFRILHLLGLTRERQRQKVYLDNNIVSAIAKRQ
jgi:hypothetical protein